MKVLHVSPTYFGDGSVVGGAERYVLELARAMARRTSVTLLSFAERPSRRREGGLEIVHLARAAALRGHPLSENPLAPALYRWLRWADVVHCHQVRTLTTDAALIAGRLLGRRVFLTDLGGGHKYALSHYVPLLRRADGLLLLSEYSRARWSEAEPGSRPRRMVVVSGGVDPERFLPGPGPRSRSALFVGRLLPHKGVDCLIDALDDGLALDVVGRPYHRAYFELLVSKSRDRRVTFHTAVDDGELVRRYQGALVTVMPSVSVDCYGRHTPIAELLGLAALESMACGTPSIVSRVAALPEIVEDGVTGFIVPPNDPAAIRERVRQIAADPRLASAMGRRGREAVLARFTWDAVAGRCLDAYQAGATEAAA